MINSPRPLPVTSKTVYAIVRAFQHETEPQAHVLNVRQNGIVEVFTSESGYTAAHNIPAAILEKARGAVPHTYVY